MERQLKKALLTTRPCKYLNEGEVDMLLNYCKLATFNKGDVLLQQGKISDGMFIIIIGRASISAKVLGEESVQFASLEQGNFMGEVNLINKLRCAATVVAEEATKCLLLTASYFDMLSIFFPEIHYKITKAITEEVCFRIKVLYQKIISIMNEKDMEKRSFFSKLIETFAKPEATTWKELDINSRQFKDIDFFKKFSDEEYALFMQEIVLIKTENHCSLIKTNSQDCTYFLILRGAVQSTIVEQTKMAKLSVLAPMCLFGSTAFIDHSPSIITYTTCERAVLASMSMQTMLKLQKNFALWNKVYYAISESFVELEQAADKLLIRLNSEFYNR